MLPLLDLFMPLSYPLQGLTWNLGLLPLFLIFILNYVINLILGRFLLKLANFDFAGKRRRFLTLFAFSTFVIFVWEFVIGFFWPFNYVLAGVLLIVVYLGIFRAFDLSWKRAFAYGLIFAILTNPLVGDLVLGLPSQSHTSSFGSARMALPDLAKKVEARGVGIEMKENTQFEKDETIVRIDVKGSSSILTSNIFFSCAEPEFCANSDAPLMVTTDRITVKQKTTGGVAVCSGDGIKFYVCVAKSKDSAANACTAKCGLG